MALDALWTVEFQVSAGWMNGGVIVLKSGHVFGGDSSRYYLGTFKAEGVRVNGELRLIQYFGQGPTAWGDYAAVVDARVAGEVGAGAITGQVSRSGHPDLSFRMTRRAELP